jgi:hypothetical protein
MPFQLRYTAAAVVLFSATLGSAQAGVTVTVTEVGSNLVFAGSGTLNLSSFSLGQTSCCGGPFVTLFANGGGIMADLGNTYSVPVRSYNGTVLSAPTFGNVAGFDRNAFFGQVSAASGDTFGVYYFGGNSVSINVAPGYSGGALSNSTTFTNASLTDLGLAAGDYTWTWGSGGAGESFTISVPSPVPEPGTYAMLLAGLGMLGAMKRRRSST